MKNKIHIQGFGLVGSLIGLFLEEMNIPFTWNDTREKHTAWKASTGCVFPTGDPGYMSSYKAWTALFQCEKGQLKTKAFMFPQTADFLRPYMERGLWCYNSKNPPHEGSKIGIESAYEFPEFVISNNISYHFNVQRIVKRAREKFANRRVSEAPLSSHIIVSHGSATATRFTWGWSGYVEMNFDKSLSTIMKAEALRPCLYFRKVYSMTYCYPRPGSKLYYAGTSSVSQSTPTTPRNTDLDEAVRLWGERMEERSGGIVRLSRVVNQSLREGWRPIPAEDASLVSVDNKKIICKPMAGNGLRRFPELFIELIQTLKEEVL